MLLAHGQATSVGSLTIVSVMQCRPIYIQHLGQVNIKKIYDVTTEDRMLKFHVQEWERCIKYIFPACSKVGGRHIDQVFSILDVKGVFTILHGGIHSKVPYRMSTLPLQRTAFHPIRKVA